MKKSLLLFILIFLFPLNTFAQRGCCSHHRGVCGCNKNGRTICCDNTLSPSCTCDPPRINGCTDSKADNYNPDANNDDGSCHYIIKGCTDKNANNYNANANTDDGNCRYNIYGCTDRTALNYNFYANIDDGSCTYPVKEEIVGIVNNDVNKKTSNIQYNQKDNEISGTNNDKGTLLFYLTTILGGTGYGIYKKSIKK